MFRLRAIFLDYIRKTGTGTSGSLENTRAKWFSASREAGK